MAKIQKSMTFTNAVIDIDNDSIIECSKDGDPIGTYSLTSALKSWDGVYGVAISIRQSNDMNPFSSDGDAQ